MKYFTFGEILLAAFGFLLSGIVLGTLRQSVQCVLSFVKLLFLKCCRSVNSALHFCFKNSFLSRKKKKTKATKKLMIYPFRQLWYLAFTLAFGIVYLLCSYLLADGAFRVYYILVMLLGFRLSDRYIGRYFSIVLKRILKILTCVAKRLISPIFFFIKRVACGHILRRRKNGKAV